MGSVGLKLADHKIEAVLFTSRKTCQTSVDLGNRPRKLLESVVISRMEWSARGEALKIKECLRKIAAVNRLSALRVSCAFRLVSDDAVCVIVEMIPIDLLIVEKKQLYELRSSTREEQEEHESG